jgi:electron transfer flavoprotein alpha subunit
MEKYKVSIVCELSWEGTVAPVCYELTTKAQELVKDIENSEVQVIIVGKRMNYDGIIDGFSWYGADKVIIVNDDILEEYSANLYRKAISEIIEEEKPQIVLFGATIRGRELAPLVATTIDTGLTADCTGLEIEEGKLVATRPTFGGKMNAQILCKTTPQMATVRPDVFKAVILENKKETEVKFDWVNTHGEEKFTKILELLPEYASDDYDLSKAEIIYAGGRGMKSKENFNRLFELARLTGGVVGASRGAVEAGFADSSIQIGQTGKTIHAKIYIAFGISGLAQHMAGINSCDKIISVNKDAEAPIMKLSDMGIVGDAAEVITEMVKQIKERHNR